MSQVQTRRLQATLGTMQIAIIALVVITALVHLQRGIGMLGGGFGGGPPGGFRGGQGGPPGGFQGGQGGPGGFQGGQGGPPGGFGGSFAIMQYLPLPLPILFLLNGIGYLVLVTALYLPALHRFQPIVRWLLILFAAGTIVMYFLFNGFRLNPIGTLDKVIEVALIILLLIDGRRSTHAMADVVHT